MTAQSAHIRWLADLIGLDPPEDDLEYLAEALQGHAQLMQPLASYGCGYDAGYPDDDTHW